MAIDGATETDKTKTNEAEGAKSEPEKKPSAAPQPPPAAAKSESEKPAGEGRGSSRVIDDDELPADEKEEIRISVAAFKKRLGRFSKSQLKEHFGTTDPDEIKGKLKKLEKLESEAEEARKAKLSEEEKTKEELAREKARADAAEARAAEAEDRHAVLGQERRIASLAAKHIDDDLLDDAVERFRRYLSKELTPKEMKKLDDAAIAKWFAELATSKPKFARVAGGGGGETKPEPAKKPLTNGVGSAKPPQRKGDDVGYDPARANPKHPQAYTKQQLQAFKDQGLW